MRHRGFTLIEIMVCLVLGVLLMGMTFWLFVSVLGVFAKADAQTDALQNLLKLQARLTREGAISSRSALYIYGDDLSYPSAGDPPAVDSGGHPLWNRYLLYYLDSQTVKLAEVPIDPPAPQCPALPDFAGNPLSYYAHDGRPIATGIQTFHPQMEGAVMSVEMQATQVNTRSAQPENVTLKAYVYPRN